MKTEWSTEYAQLVSNQLGEPSFQSPLFYVREVVRHIGYSTDSQDKRASINAQESFLLGKVGIEKLGMIVNEAIKAFSITTHLAQSEVVDILGKINVVMLDEVQAAVESLNGIEGIDTVRITVAIEETIKAIAAMTNLDTDAISRILTERNGSSVEDIVNRLHVESKGVCSNS